MTQSAPALPDTLPAEWRTTLAAAGAVFDDHGHVDRFADIRDEVRAAADATVVADLSPLSTNSRLPPRIHQFGRVGSTRSYNRLW